MNTILYSPCSKCKHKSECYDDILHLTFCDVCELTVYKKRHERVIKKVVSFLNGKDVIEEVSI